MVTLRTEGSGHCKEVAVLDKRGFKKNKCMAFSVHQDEQKWLLYI